LIRCGDCGVEGRDESLFRPYYPSINGPAIHYCPTCWGAREVDAQQQGLKFAGGLIVAVVLAAVFFELGSSSQLARLGLLVLAFELSGTILHELGHAVVAIVLGLRVHTMSFGYGPVLYSRRVGPWVLELCSVPVCGSVTVAGRSRTFPRLRQALACLGGPAANVALAFVAWRYGIGDFPDAGLSMSEITPWHIMFSVNVSIVVLNLVPFAFPPADERAGAWQANDGLLTLKSLVASKDVVDGWASVALAWEAEALIRSDGGATAARELVDKAVGARPHSLRLRLLQGRLLLKLEDWDAAAGSFKRVLDSADSIHPGDRATAMAGVAAAALGAGQPERARNVARKALELDPSSLAARLAHGQALLAGGWVAKAEAAFDAVLRHSTEPSVRAVAACGAAQARHQSGDPEGRERLLALARALDPNCPDIATVERTR
jgi:hypothetical protein